jgi:hypothetical protein
MKYNFTSTQDWNFYFAQIFENEKIGNMIEFGLGVGTPYLADNCNFLKSVELSLGAYNLEWYNKTVDDMKNYKNWESKYVNVNEKIADANDRAQRLRFPLSDVSYLKDLKTVFAESIGDKKYDFIFVDAGIHTRGDLVNMSFGRADIIAAHDTSRDTNRVLENVYGYNIVNVPNGYVEIHFEDTYMGTTIWVKNTKKDLIKILKNYKVQN